MNVLNKDGCKYLIEKIKSNFIKKVSAGNATKPVYINANGVPTACSYTLAAACAKGVATSVASGNANLVTSGAVYTALADKGAYEEGVWTPKFFNTASNEITSTIAINYGRYVKIGNLVFIEGYIEFNSQYACHSIKGLPFTPSNGNGTLTRFPVYVTDYAAADNLSTFNEITSAGVLKNAKYASTKTSGGWYISGCYRTA